MCDSRAIIRMIDLEQKEINRYAIERFKKQHT